MEPGNQGEDYSHQRSQKSNSTPSTMPTIVLTCGREKISLGGTDIYEGLHKNLDYKIYINREVTTKKFILNLSPLCKIANPDSIVIIRKLD